MVLTGKASGTGEKPFSTFTISGVVAPQYTRSPWLSSPQSSLVVQSCRLRALSDIAQLLGPISSQAGCFQTRMRFTQLPWSCLPARQGSLLRARPGHSSLCSRATTPSYGAASLGSMHMFTVRLITNISQAHMSTLIRLHVLENSPCAGHRLHCMDIPSAEAV